MFSTRVSIKKRLIIFSFKVYNGDNILPTRTKILGFNQLRSVWTTKGFMIIFFVQVPVRFYVFFLLKPTVKEMELIV